MNQLNRKKVLLVDDEPEIIEIMAEELGRRGIECLEANDGETALKIIEEEKPALIVSDYRMPRLNGMELLTFLSDLKISTPVIWLTAFADKETFREAWRLGVYDFFEKPFRAEEIADQVAAALTMDPEVFLNRKPKFLNKENFRQIELDLDRELFEKVKKLALNESKSISRLISGMLHDLLDK